MTARQTAFPCPHPPIHWMTHVDHVTSSSWIECMACGAIGTATDEQIAANGLRGAIEWSTK